MIWLESCIVCIINDNCTLYLIAHLTPYFISLFVSYFILTIFVYIYILSRVLFHSFYCFYVIIMFYFIYFLHFPLSGPVLINISLPIIPCMIVYVTNNKEPWTLNLELNARRFSEVTHPPHPPIPGPVRWHQSYWWSPSCSRCSVSPHSFQS